MEITLFNLVDKSFPKFNMSYGLPAGAKTLQYFRIHMSHPRKISERSVEKNCDAILK